MSTQRRSPDGEQATAARDAAQDVFVGLDRAQKLGAARVLAFARLDAGPEGARLKAAWAPLAGAADEAAARFLATLDRYPVAEHATAQDLRAAAGAYTAARQALTGVTERVESFLRSHDQLLQRVERAYATLGPATASAASAVAGARASAAATRAAGLDSAELARALTALDDAAGLLAQGATVHGLAQTLRLAEAATAAAGTVDAVVAALARDRDTAAAALGSLPTRREIVAHRIAALAPVLSRLRREYAARSFADVAQDPAHAQDLADRASVRAAEVQSLLSTGRTTEAAAAAAGARRLYAEAEAACTEVTDRLQLLDRASTDPHGTARQAWFVIRDAQRLVRSRGAAAHPGWAARLDGAALQLQGAEEALVDGVHPDYLRFIVALDSARDTAAAVIAEVRQQR